MIKNKKLKKQKIQFILSADLQHSSFVRTVSNEVFKMVKFSKEWCSRLKLVVDELFMNAVQYGSNTEKSLIHISFEYNEESVYFCIEDDGTGSKKINSEQLKSLIDKNKENTDLTKTSGRGLAMITDLWTDNMLIEDSEFGGIKVSFSKSLKTAVVESDKPSPVGLVQQQVEHKNISENPIKMEVSNNEKVSEKKNGPTYKIKLSGEIDKTNIEEKLAPLSDQIRTIPKNSTLILDFSNLNYINSTFIGTLADWHNILSNNSGRICVKNLNEEVKEILDLVGLFDILTCSDF